MSCISTLSRSSASEPSLSGPHFECADPTERILALISALPPGENHRKLLAKLNQSLVVRQEELERKIDLGKEGEHDQEDLFKLYRLIQIIQQRIAPKPLPNSPSKIYAIVNLLFPNPE